MPRSSRHKSHKQSKHSSKEVKEYSDSEGDDVRMKESGSGRVSKDSGHSASGEKRKLASQLKEGKDLSGHGNGEAAEEYVSSKRRKEKAEAAAGGDRWNGGGDDRGDSGGLEKESRGESLKHDGEKGSKSREQSKSKSSKRHESGGERKEDRERKEDNVGSVVEKEDGRSGGRSESKRRSEREKEGKEVREKERGSEREKKALESKRDPEAYLVDGAVQKKQGTHADDFGDERQSRRSRNDTEWRMQDELQNPEFEKESEKRNRKKREGSDADKYLDDYRDSDEKRTSSRGDRAKEAKYRDEKHKDAGMYGEDGDREDRHRDYKYREDDRGSKHRDDFDRDSTHRDDKYRADGDRDSRSRDDKYREDGDRDNRRRDDKYRENGEKDSRRRDEKYREDGDRDSKRKHREDGEKESRSSDGRYKEDADRDGKHKDEKHREDTERDNRHKEEKHRDDYERESSQRDGKQADDDDREKRRVRETKYRDERGSKDRSSDKSVTKRLRDESHTSDLHSRKGSMRDNNPGYDDRSSRYKDDQGRRKAYDKEDHGYFRSQGTKDQLSDVEKRSAASGRIELATDRGRSTSRNADMDLASTHGRRHSSPSSSSHISRDQYRISKQDESKYRDYSYEDRSRHNLTSGREYTGAAGSGDKKHFPKDDSHFGDLATERRLRSNARNSPLPLVDKSPSATSAERRHLSRTDVRRSLDIEEPGKRSGGSRDGKDYSSIREVRGSREVAMENFQGDDHSQADGDNIDVSSPFTRIGSLAGNSKSLLPPPSFRTGVDSPFGASEDDSRGKSNNLHRRISDPNMGRLQGNSWRGVPNWASPMANGFMSFQHGPPPIGFHPVIPQFPAPPLFGVRPSMELNHPGVPFHVPDAERFSGHGRPMGWRNPADDSCPPPLHGWDANNVVYGEDSHIFGRPDWDTGRVVPSGRGWETSGDMWKGPNSSGSAELLPSSAKENHLNRGGEDQSLGAQSGIQAGPEDSQPDIQDESNETSRQSDAPEKKGLEPLKLTPDATPNVDDKSKEDDVSLSQLYLSKLDISADLAEPELYIQCTGLLDMDNSPICDVLCAGLLEEEFMEDRVTKTNQVPNALFFAAANNNVFQKAMTLYKKHKEEIKDPSLESLPSSSEKDELVRISAEEDLGSKGVGVAEELHVPADDKESDNVLPTFSMEVELPAHFENVEEEAVAAAAAAASEEIAAAANLVDKSEGSIFTSSNTSMEVHVASDVESSDHIIDDDSASVQNVGEATDHSAASAAGAGGVVEDTMMPKPNSPEGDRSAVSGGDEDATMPKPNSPEGDVSADNNNEGKELVETKCETLVLSDVPVACEVVMEESIEYGPVNLSGIHHSPESTR